MKKLSRGGGLLVTENEEEIIPEEKVEMPAQNFMADSSKGIHVEASVGEDILPKDVTLFIRDVSESKAKEIAEGAIKENEVVTGAIALDISFRDENFKEVEPINGAVSVKITFNKPLDSGELKVMHKEDNGEVSVLEHKEASEESVSFDAESFSIYVVATVEQEDPRMEVRFFMPGASDPFNTQFVTSGDELHDPGIVESAMDADDIFVGWNANGTDYENIDGIRALIPSSITAGSKLDVTAVIHNERRLIYRRLDDIVMKSEDVISGEDSSTFTVNQAYTVADGNLGFVGWTYADNITAVEADGSVTLADDSLIFKNGSTITVTVAETALKPVVKAGHWITYDENDGGTGGGASFTAPEFYLATDTTVEPEAPTRPGYDFDGWYTEATGGTKFTFGQTISGYVNLFAHWTPKQDTLYTVIIWQQKVTDDKDASDDQKTYAYVESHEISAATGATIQASDISAYTGYNYTGFDYRTYEVVDGSGNPTTTVGAKGDTVVNVYYDRELWMIKFYISTTDNYTTTPEQYDLRGNNVFERLTYSNGYWRRPNNSAWTGTRYKVYDTFTGLYGQSLSQYGYTWPHEIRWSGVSFVSSFDGALFGNSSLGRQAGAIIVHNETNTGNVTILSYLQDPNNPNVYTLASDNQASYNVTDGNGFLITDRFLGFEPDGYKWSSSDTMPSSWDYAVNENGYTDIKKSSSDSYLHLRFKRVRSSIIFEYDNSEIGRVDNIPYGKSIAEYESQTPEINVENGYYIAGWYEDPLFTDPVDWNSDTMPAENKAIYAKAAPERFHMVFDADGGVVPNGQSLSFRVPYGTIIESVNFENTTKENHILIGWYDENGSLFNFNTHIDENVADMTYKDDDARRAEYGDNTAENADVVGLVKIHAVWRDETIANAGGIGLRYIDSDTAGNEVIHEVRPDHRYLDRTTAVAQNITDSIAEKANQRDEVFVGWQVGDNEDVVVAAGDLINVLASDAVLGDDGYVITLKAKYVHKSEVQIINTKLVYKANGGTGADVVEEPISINGKIPTMSETDGKAAFTRDGYKLAGWSKNPNTQADSTDMIVFGANVYVNANNEDEENILYAIWKQDTFTVTWADDTGAMLEIDQNVASGTIPEYNGATPTKARTQQYTYTFKGWDKEIVPVTENVTYTATYNQTVNQYTVTYNLNGGTTESETTYTVDYGTATPTITTTRQGYTFKGWSPTVASTVTQDVTYNAQWEAADVNYTVRHYGEKLDGTGYELLDSYQVVGKTDEERNAEPHSFPGFEIDWEATRNHADNADNEVDESTSKVKGVVKADGSLVLALVYKRLSYRIIYEYDGNFAPTGAVPSAADVANYDTKSYKYGETVTVKDITTVPAGYTFSGFEPISGSTLVITGGTFTMPARNVELHGHFTANSTTKYTVRHVLKDLTGDNYSTVLSEYPKTGTTDTEGSASERASEFAGAKYNEDATRNNMPAGVTMTDDGHSLKGNINGDESLVLTFYYDREEYTVSYVYDGYEPNTANPAGENLPAPATYKYGQEVTRIADSTAEAYTFSGWTLQNPDFVISADGKFNMPARNVQFHGSFTPKASGTTFDIEHYQQQLDGSYVKVDADSKTYTGTALQRASANAQDYAGFKLNWTKIREENTGADYEYQFDEGTKTISGKILGDHSLVLRFYYDRETYKVTYRYDGNLAPDGADPDVAHVGELDTTEYKYGEEVTIKTVRTTPAGYTFSGFAPIEGSTIIVTGGKFTMPARNVELHGHFTADNDTKYKVEHYLKDLEGDTYTLLTSYEKTGTTDTEGSASERASEFDGARYDEDATRAKMAAGVEMSADGHSLKGNINGDDINNELVLAFYYDREEYTVSYVYDGYEPTDAIPTSANLPAPTTYKFGQTVTRTADSTAEGYTFSGWTLQNPDFPIGQDGTFNMPARNVQFHGSFTPTASGTTFNIEHYQQQLDGSYVKVDADSKTYTGTALDRASANAQDYAGYKVNWTKIREANTGADYEYQFDESTKTVSGKILGDHSLVLRFYYDRETYKVTYRYDGNIPNGTRPDATEVRSLDTADYKFEQEVSVKKLEDFVGYNVPAGYSFSGFAPIEGSTLVINEGKFNMPARNVELHGHFTADNDTKYKVEHYLKKLDGSGYDLITSYEKTGTTDTVGSANERASEFDGAKYDAVKTEEEALAKGLTVSADKESLSGNINGDDINNELVLAFYYDREEYTVSYVYDGYEPTDAIPTSANLPAPTTYKFGETVTRIADATANGYDFSGWTLQTADFDIDEATGTFNMPARNVQFHGTFTPHAGGSSFKINHYKEQLSGIYALDTDVSGTFTGTALQTATANAQHYTGYKVNWAKTTDENAGNTVNETAGTVSGTILGDDSLVLNVYYDLETYRVIYEYDGNTAPDGAVPSAANVENHDETLYKMGETVTVKDVTKTPDGYTFSGFAPIEGSTLVITGGTFTMPARNVELHGHFTANNDTKYKVIHYLKDVSGDGYTEITNYEKTGTTDTLGSASERANDFAGAIYDSAKTEQEAIANGLTISDDKETLSGNINGDDENNELVLAFYYNRDKYTVSYVYDGYEPTDAVPTSENLPAATEYTYGQEVTRIADATANGYDFSGWTLQTSDFPIAADGTFEMPARNVQFHGSFTPVPNDSKFKVEHYQADLDGNYAEAYETFEYQGTARQEAIVNAQHYAGYKVDWTKTKAENNPDKVNEAAGTVSGTIMGDDSLVLKFYYERETYKVTYRYDGNTAPEGAIPSAADVGNLDTTDYKYEEEVTVKDITTVPAGYSFSGFAPIEGSTITVTGGKFKMPARNVELHGHFTADNDTKYKVEHYLKKLDGSGYDLITSYEKTGTTDTTGSASERASEFAGAVYDEDATRANKAAGVDMSADGKSLKGNINGDVENNQLVLAFYYSRDKYTVSYVYDGYEPTTANPASADLPAPVEYTYGQEVTRIADATANGYDFSGWTLQTADFDIDEATGTFNMPARNVQFHGSFTPVPNGSKFKVEQYQADLDGNYVLKESKEYYGDALGSATVNAQDYTGFDINWDKTEAENTGNTVSRPAGTISGTIKGDNSLVIKFYYDRETYKVTYRYDGNTAPDGAVPSAADVGNLDTTEYKFEEEVTVKDVTTIPAGYTFSGFTTVSGSTLVITGGTFKMPARNVELHGHFTANNTTKYTVRHLLKDLEGNGYTLLANGEYFKTGTTDTLGSANERQSDFDGVVYDKDATRAKMAAGVTMSTDGESLSGSIKGDESLVLEFYYNRAEYSVDYYYTGNVPVGAGSLPTSIDYPYEEEVTIEARPNVPAGYEFVGWEKRPNSDLVIDVDSGTGYVSEGATFEMPDRDVTFYGHFNPKTDTPYKVEHYIQDVNDPTVYTELKETENKTGTTDTTVSASPKTTSEYNGFTVDWTKTKAEKGNNTVDESAGTISGVVVGSGELVLKIYYKRNSYKLNYVYTNTVDGATPLPAEETHVFGEEVTLAPRATAPGYEFFGWYVRGDADPSTRITMPANDTWIDGSFEARNSKYDVEFYYEANGTYDGVIPEVDTREAQTGTDVAVTTDDTTPRTGYVLDNSVTNTTSGKVTGYDDTTTPSTGEKLVLKLHFKQVFTVIYQPGEHGTFNEVIHRNKFYNDATPTAPETSGEEGYIFTGWNEKGKDVAEKVTADVTYVAKWSEDKNNDGTPDEDQEFKVVYTDNVENEEVFADKEFSGLHVGDEKTNYEFGENPTRENYVFTAWEPVVADSVKAEDAKDSTDKLTITYKAQWALDENGNGIPDSEDRFKVIYKDGVDGEDLFADQEYPNLRAGSATPAFDGTPERENYVFDTWSPYRKQTVNAVDAKESEDKLTITYNATWKDDKNNNGIADEEESFTVVYTKGEHGDFEDDEHTNLSLNEKTPEYAGEKDAFDNPKPQENYVFVGWEPTVSETIKAEDANEDSTITYTALWKDDKNNNGVADDEEYRTITYKDGADGEVFADQVYENQLDGLDTPPFEGTLERKDYVFDKWSPEVSEKVDGDATYTATWKDDKNNNGIPDEDETIPLSYPDADKDEDGDKKPDVVTEDVPYGSKIAVNPNGGTWRGSDKSQILTVNEDTQDALLEEPTRTDYVFTGWKKSSGEEDIKYNFTAQWKDDKNNNGIPDEDETIPLSYPDADKDEDGDKKPDVVTEDVPYGATITVDPNGGTWRGTTDPSTFEANEDTKDALLEEPTRDDYVFTGWKKTQDGEDYTFTATWKEDKNNNGIPDEDETIPLSYPDADKDEDGDKKPDIVEEEVPYGSTITVDPNGGTWRGSTEPSTFDANEDTQDALMEEPTRPDYVFAGWKKSQDGENYTFTATWKEDKNNNGIPDEDETVPVNYPDATKDEDGDGKPDTSTEDVPYGSTITVDPSGGTWRGSTEPTPLTADENLEDALMEEPTRDDYVFVGWKLNKDGEDYTFTAEWKEDKNHNGIPDELEDHYTIIYDFNGGALDGIHGPISQTYVVDEEITIIKAPRRDGYVFDYWEGSKHYPGDKYTVVENHKFTAIWKKVDNRDNTPSHYVPNTSTK